MSLAIQCTNYESYGNHTCHVTDTEKALTTVRKCFIWFSLNSELPGELFHRIFYMSAYHLFRLCLDTGK